jgi:WD40 repeat protein/tRNA A-37 threonylcarbamoyl transferase component Bud32
MSSLVVRRMSDSDSEIRSPPSASPESDAERTLLQQPAEAGITPRSPAFTNLPPLYRLGEYELLEEIGRGGMGVVFKARHVRLHRLVALKMILGGLLARPEDLQRFETEAAAAAQLQHPNIVALYEAGTQEGQPYLSMEFVSGSSLAQRIALGVLPGRLAASYLERLARAVHYAHSRGIIHRDLKPQNVLLDGEDQPKITDFGLAKVLQSDSSQTRTGAVLGTPSYMAPEQAKARKDIGPAADIYSLGAILYELLTGSPPFRGETALGTLSLVAEKEPVPPHLLNPKVDRDLETICLKCLEKDPARRYATAEALAQDLRRYLNNEPITARRLGAVGRAVKWCRRRPAAAALLVVSVLALVGFALFQWQTARTERELRQEAERSERKARLRQTAMRHLAYLAQMHQAQHLCENADLSSAERILGTEWLPRQGLPDLRDWEWYFLKGLCQGRASLPPYKGRATAVAFHPDGRQLATAGGEVGRPGQIKTWDMASGRLLRTFPRSHNNMITALAFHPAGKVLASASDDGTIGLWEVDSGRELTHLTGHSEHVNSVAFSADGKLLAAGGSDQFIRIWDVDKTLHGTAKPFVLEGHSGEVSSVAFGPGRLLASAGFDETVRLWDAATGTLLRTLRGHAGEVRSVALSRDGKLLVSGGGPGLQRGEVRLWEPATGKVLGIHYGLSGRVLAVAISRDGRVAAAGNDGLVHVWDQRTSSEPLVFRSDVRAVYALVFNPAGGQLACAGSDGRVRLWHSDGGQEALRLPGPARAEAVAFSPDGKLIAGCGSGVKVWQLANRTRKAALAGHLGSVRALAFSHDSRLLATGGDDRTIRIHDLNNGQAVRILDNQPGRVLALAFHPREDLLASAGDGEDIRLWDARTGRLVRTFSGHSNGILALAFSPNGQLLASASYDKTVRVWDSQSGASFVLKGHTKGVNAVAFSPDGSQLASGGNDRTVRLWDLHARSEYIRLEMPARPVVGLAYHPGGRRLATVGDGRSLHLWDLVTRQQILELPGPDGGLRSVAFSGDGRYLATAGHSAGLRVWEAPVPEVRSASQGGPP